MESEQTHSCHFAQCFWEKIEAQIPEVEMQIAQGEFHALREWLRVNVHQHGRKFTACELLQRVIGCGIEVGPFMRYLQAKFGEIYALDAQSS